MAKLTREEIRQQIFNSDKAKPKFEMVEFMGAMIEVRQPPIEQIMAMGTSELSNNLVALLIRYCYVPGGEETLFSEIDYETLLAMPMNDEFKRLTDALQKLLDMPVTAEVKNSEKTPSATT